MVSLVDKLVSAELSKRRIICDGVQTAEYVQRGVKLSTLRRNAPHYRGFKPGEVVTLDFPDHLEPEVTGYPEERRTVIDWPPEPIRELQAVVWGSVEDVPLSQVDPVVLALDGFMSAEEALEGLQRAYRNRGIQMSSPVTALCFLEQTNMHRFLGEKEQEILLSQGSGRDLSEVVRAPELQELVRRSIASWTWLKGGSPDKWLHQFLWLGLMTDDELDMVRDYHHNYSPRPVFGDRHAGGDLLTEPYGSADEMYRVFVLGDTSNVSL